MPIQVDLLTDPVAAGGTRLASIETWSPDSSYGAALDGNATCALGVPDGSSAAALLRVRRILRLLRSSTNAAGALTTTLLGEYRIRKITREAGAGLIRVEAHPLLLDLADVYVSVIVGGTESYAIDVSQLTRTEWINNYLKPSLARAGYTWIDIGTIDPDYDDPISLTFERWTCLQLLRALTARTEVIGTLDNAADLEYQINIGLVGGTAPAAAVVVGRNVEALQWEQDGVLQATVVIPRGVTAAGELEPRGPSEYGAEVATVAASSITLTDADTFAGLVLEFDDQEKNSYLEWLMTPIQLRDLSFVSLGAPGTDSLQKADRLAPQQAIYIPGTDEIAVSVIQTTATNPRVVFYNATTRQYVAIVTVAGAPFGLYYHAGQNKIYCATAGGVSVINATTHAIITTIAVGANPTWVAYASSSDRVYVLNSTANSISVINPATDTVAATIAGITNPTDLCYDSTNDRIVVCTATDLKFINPNTNVVANTLAMGATVNNICYRLASDRLYVSRTASNDVKRVNGAGAPAVDGTITGLTSPTFIFSEDVNGTILLIHNTTKLAMINPANADALEETAKHLGPGPRRLGPAITAQRIVYANTTYTNRGFLLALDVDTLGPVTRRLVTSTVQATQTVNLAIVKPLQPYDVVSFRADADGTLREQIAHPVHSLPAPTGYGHVARVLTSDVWRGERNYALNPWGSWGPNGLSEPNLRGWDRNRGPGSFQPQSFTESWDASTWLTDACTANGAHSIGANALLLSGLTPGDMIQPGDYVSSAAVLRMNSERGVVDGSGNVQLRIPGGLPGNLVNGQALTLERSGVKGLLSGNYTPVLYCDGSVGTAQELGQWLVPPSITSRTTLWITIEVDVWCFSIQPSTKLALKVYDGDTVVATTFHSDTTTYTDKLVRRFAISYAHTVPGGGPRIIGAFCQLVNGAIGTVYVRRLQATIGTEGALEPPMRVNASLGKLYHTGWQAIRDLAQPPVVYVVQPLEDQEPMVLGGRLNLEHAQAGIAATPRVVAIDYPLPPPGTESIARRPRVTLDNRPASLARLLAEAGIS